VNHDNIQENEAENKVLNLLTPIIMANSNEELLGGVITRSNPGPYY
jgi:hypothetical protein